MDSDGSAWSALDAGNAVFPVRDENQASEPANLQSSLPRGLARGATRWLDWSRSDTVFIDLVKLADLLLLTVAGLCAYGIQFLRSGGGGGDIAKYLVVSALAGAAALAYLASRGLYTRAALNEAGPQLPNLAVAVLVGLALWVSFAFATKISGDFSRVAVAAWVALGFAFLAGARIVIVWRSRAWARQGRFLHRVAIVGANAFCGRVVAGLRATADTWTEIVGVYDDDESAAAAAFVPVAGTVRELSAHLRTNVVHSIVICLPLTERERIKQAVAELHGAAADIQLAVDVDGLVAPVGRTIGCHSMVSLSERPLKGWSAVRKMLFDRVAGAVLLLLASPVLLVVALLIKLDSRGPVLFRQPRRGFNDGVFTLYKFRTMHAHAMDVMADRLTEREDPRITRIGRHLRRFSLDELPQLWNVVIGDMSLVGPRPHALNAKAADRLYAEVVAGYARRHRVKPGITGWAQINGWRGETATEEQIINRVSHDLHYIENWSLALDLKILAVTLLRELKSRHAY